MYYLFPVSNSYFCSSRNGVGRIDIVENRFVGMKSRGNDLLIFSN